MFCPECGSKMNDDEIFCSQCGMNVKNMMEQQRPVQPMPAQPQMQLQAQHQQRPVQPMPAQPQMQSQAQQQQRLVQPMPAQPQMQLQAQQQIPPKPPKKSKDGLIAGIIIGLILIASITVGVLAGAGIIGGKDKDRDKEKDTSEAVTSANGEDSTTADIGGNETSKNDVTIMFYVVGSNLESGIELMTKGVATADINEVIGAKEKLDNMTVVMQTGGCSDWQNDVMKDGEVQRFHIDKNGIKEDENLGKMSMLESKSLSDFITYSATNYPAEKYVLVMWDHGGGIPIGFGKDEMYPDDSLTEVEFNTALQTSGIHFETVAFDACDMDTLEVAVATKDYADYLVAAESLTLGVGLDYTSWITTLSDDRKSIKYTEKMVDSYFEAISKCSDPGTMAVINLDRIDDVITAYETYIGDVYESIAAGDYAGYTQARKNCGFLNSSDSVDIVTLANNYKMDSSSKLIDAVVNAVDYTSSDIDFVHGMAVYSPFEHFDMYTNGRVVYANLAFGEKIVNFYDAYVSAELSYLGSDYVTKYAGEWYSDAFISNNEQENISEDEIIKFEVDREGNRYINFSDQQWNSIAEQYITVLIYDEENELFYTLGQDVYNGKDSEGRFVASLPTGWVKCNGEWCTYFNVSSTRDEETGEWSEIGGIFAYVNGNESIIMIEYNNEYVSGHVLGYMPYTFDGTGEKADMYYQLNEDDMIQPVCTIVNMNASQENQQLTYQAIGESTKFSDSTITYTEAGFSDLPLVVAYEFKDVYGAKYKTESITFNIEN